MIAGIPVNQMAGYRVPMRLTDDEVRQVRSLAVEIEDDHRARGWQHKWPYRKGEDAVEVGARSLGAEIAARNVTGLEWNGGVLRRTTPKPPDLGRRTEVKTSPYHRGNLWSRGGDRDDWLYVLVTGTLPLFVVHGWIEGAFLRDQARWVAGVNGHPPGYCLGCIELRPFPLPEDA